MTSKPLIGAERVTELISGWLTIYETGFLARPQCSRLLKSLAYDKPRPIDPLSQSEFVNGPF